MSKQNVLYVGVMGFSGKPFDKEKAEKIIRQAFDLINAVADPNVEIAIVAGWTDLGIPGIAYKIAAEYNWITVGVACSKAKDFKCFPCDEVIVIGEKWRDKSPTFLAKCDVFIRVGGGEQTFLETAAAQAMGKVVLEFDLPELKVEE